MLTDPRVSHRGRGREKEKNENEWVVPRILLNVKSSLSGRHILF